ncbi:hypothetical protein [Helicobacter phage PtB92G]|nr:hypothetical protein [Helicobacter phage PtB92G]
MNKNHAGLIPLTLTLLKLFAYPFAHAPKEKQTATIKLKPNATTKTLIPSISKILFSIF